MSCKSLSFLIGTAALLLATSARTASSQAMPSVWDGIYTVDQAQRGKEQYQKSCSACHGPNMEGQGMAAALSGETFRTSWSGKSVFDLIIRIQTTMPQDDPGSLSAAASRDIVAFVIQTNGFPAGTSEIMADSAALKRITISREKP